MPPLTSLPAYAANWARDMPQFSPLPAFLADLSQSTQAFSKHPDFMIRGRAHAAAKALQASRGGHLGAIVKALALRALIWLLRADLLVQLHVRLRVKVRPEIKAAWRAGKEVAAQERAQYRAATSANQHVQRQHQDQQAQRTQRSAFLSSSKQANNNAVAGGAEQTLSQAAMGDETLSPSSHPGSLSLRHAISRSSLPHRHPDETGDSYQWKSHVSPVASSRSGVERPAPEVDLDFIRRPVAPVSKSPPPSGVSLTSSHRGRLLRRGSRDRSTLGGHLGSQLGAPSGPSPDQGRAPAVTSPETRHPALPGSLGTVHSEPATRFFARAQAGHDLPRSVSRPRKVIRGFGEDEQVAIHHMAPTSSADPAVAAGASSPFGNSRRHGANSSAITASIRPSSTRLVEGHKSIDHVSTPGETVGITDQDKGKERRDKAELRATAHVPGLLSPLPLPEPHWNEEKESPSEARLLLDEEVWADSNWLQIPIHDTTIVKEPTQMTWYEGEWVDLILEQATTPYDPGLRQRRYNQEYGSGPPSGPEPHMPTYWDVHSSERLPETSQYDGSRPYATGMAAPPPTTTRTTTKASAAASTLQRILPYLNGKHSLDEIALREDLRRREIRLVRETFKDDLIEFLHP